MIKLKKTRNYKNNSLSEGINNRPNKEKQIDEQGKNKKRTRMFSIKIKITGFFSLFILIIIAVSALSIFSLNRLAGALNTIINTYENQIEIAYSLKEFNTNMNTSLILYINEPNNLFLEEIYTNLSHLKNLKNKVIQLDQTYGLSDTLNLYKDLDVIVDKIVFELRNNRQEKAEKIFRDNKITFAAISAAIDKYVKQKEKNIKELTEEVNSQNRIILKTIWVCLGASLLLVFTLTFVASNILTKPIMKITEKASAVAKSDLTVSVDIKSNDEIGILSQAFVHMTNNLKNIIRVLNRDASLLAHITQGFKESINQVATSNEQIAATIEEIASGSQEQVIHITSAKGIIENILNEMLNISLNANEASSISIQAGEYASSGNKIINEALRQMVNINDAIVKSANTIKELGEYSENILSITNIIKGIADQTDLLAINAAIEAARAGEVGRGFAVVAQETRKLAVQSLKATEEIGQIVSGIKKQIEESIEVSETGILQADGGMKIMKNVSETFDNILTNSQRLISKISMVSKSTGKVVNENDVVSNALNNIVEVAEESSAGVEEVAASIEEQNALSSEMASVVSKIAEISAGLYQIIEQFKIV
jgi:methyl-accepting chemotaxis protein